MQLASRFGHVNQIRRERLRIFMKGDHSITSIEIG
ncbi:Uncharacterised protein [Escherichia coli]|nr:Uncharacterised protein [Escherichia coli]